MTNFCRMVRYLELLEGNPPGVTKGAFERMCNYLETTDKQWICDELRTELKTVRGELVIENYIRAEAQQLVGVQFGHIRRLSEMEKLDMQKIVAQRMQHYKEVKVFLIDLGINVINVFTFFIQVTFLPRDARSASAVLLS